MLAENMTMDELVLIGRQSFDPILLEMCKRFYGRHVEVSQSSEDAIGKTIRAIKDQGDGFITIIFTDGTYFGIGGDVQDGDVVYAWNPPLCERQRYNYGLMTYKEEQYYRDKILEKEAESKAKRIEYLRKELAELEN